MFKLNFFLIILIFLPSVLHAQNLYRPGYIINSQGDTIQGFLKFDIDSRLSSEIIFKKDKNGVDDVFTANELLGFGYSTGRNFESIKPSGNALAGFYKRVVDGKIVMLTYYDGKKSESAFHLYRKDNTLHVDIPPAKVMEIEKEGKSFSVEDKKYLGKLALITGNSKSNQDLISVKHTQKSISKYIASFNESFVDTYPLSVYQEETRFTYTVTIGIAPKIVNLQPYRFTVYRDKNFIESNKFSQRIGLSIIYWSDSADPGSYQGTGSDNFIWNMTSIFPLGFQTQGQHSNFKLYAYAAIGVAFLYTKDHEYTDGEFTGDASTILPLPNLAVGGGIKYRIGKGFLLAEVNPNIFSGLYLNIGYSF